MWEEIREEILRHWEDRGPNGEPYFHIRWVPSHQDDMDMLQGIIIGEDRIGNAQADELATIALQQCDLEQEEVLQMEHHYRKRVFFQCAMMEIWCARSAFVQPHGDPQRYEEFLFNIEEHEQLQKEMEENPNIPFSEWRIAQ